jgi:hypothetical protein
MGGGGSSFSSSSSFSFSMGGGGGAQRTMQRSETRVDSSGRRVTKTIKSGPNGGGLAAQVQSSRPAAHETAWW